MISQRLLDALVAADFAPRYYELCATHGSRNLERCLCPHAEVVATLNDLGKLVKERGPGRTYLLSAPGLHERLDFSFSVQGAGTYVEPYLGLSEDSVRSGSNFSVLAHAAIALSDKRPPTPAYPRPSFYSLFELRAVVAGCLELALHVSKQVPN
jgi:hypothetical protein